jgi:hypothetical protein
MRLAFGRRTGVVLGSWPIGPSLAVVILAATPSAEGVHSYADTAIVILSAPLTRSGSSAELHTVPRLSQPHIHIRR